MSRIIKNIGDFELAYELVKKGGHGTDFQVGMDFELSNTRNPKDKNIAICQMIFPMTDVGLNKKHTWNIDNHAKGNQIIDLAYKMQSGQPIIDTPRELIKFSAISGDNTFKDETRFCAFFLNINEGSICKDGVTYGYQFSGSNGQAVLYSLNFKKYTLIPDQLKILRKRVNFLRVVD